ncbi:MAG: PEP-CTERM sorting domain-containing protein [Jatrophihabitantaceae bacterium]
MQILRTTLVACSLLAFGLALHASSITYDFSGSCSDCSGTVTGTMELSSNYVLGTSFLNDFLGFSYNGSNLFPSFTIAAPGPQSFGSLPTTLPGFAAMTLNSDQTTYSGQTGSFFFSTYEDGTWDLGFTPLNGGTGGTGGGGGGNGCNRCGSDTGTDGSWSLASPPPVVTPEPSTWTLMLGGLGLLGLGRRQRWWGALSA